MALSEKIPGMKPGSWIRNIVLGVVYLFVILIILGALAGSPSDDGAPETIDSTPTSAPDGDEEVAADGGSTQTTQTPTPTTTEPTPTPVTSPEPQEFSGSGATVTDRFQLQGGFFVAVYQHTGGSSNFQVELKDPSGEERDRLIANEIGATEGVYGEGISEGEYIMDITADGDWIVDVRQPRVARGGGEDIPLELSGDASDHYVAVNVNGIARVRATHEGRGNFVVESFTRRGERHLDSLVFNEIGDFEGETTLDYDGTTWIVIQADGPWTLTFEPA